MSIGTNIQYFRDIRNLTQAELAQRAGISQSSLSKYEVCQREPKESHILKIALALDIPSYKLFDNGIESDEFKKFLNGLSEEERNIVAQNDISDESDKASQLSDRMARRFTAILYPHLRKSIESDKYFSDISEEQARYYKNQTRIVALVDEALADLERNLEIAAEFPAVPEELYSKK